MAAARQHTRRRLITRACLAHPRLRWPSPQPASARCCWTAASDTSYARTARRLCRSPPREGSAAQRARGGAHPPRRRRLPQQPATVSGAHWPPPGMTARSTGPSRTSASVAMRTTRSMRQTWIRWTRRRRLAMQRTPPSCSDEAGTAWHPARRYPAGAPPPRSPPPPPRLRDLSPPRPPGASSCPGWGCSACACPSRSWRRWPPRPRGPRPRPPSRTGSRTPRSPAATSGLCIRWRCRRWWRQHTAPSAPRAAPPLSPQIRSCRCSHWPQLAPMAVAASRCRGWGPHGTLRRCMRPCASRPRRSACRASLRRPRRSAPLLLRVAAARGTRSQGEGGSSWWCRPATAGTAARCTTAAAPRPPMPSTPRAWRKRCSTRAPPPRRSLLARRRLLRRRSRLRSRRPRATATRPLAIALPLPAAPAARARYPVSARGRWCRAPPPAAFCRT